MARSRSRRSPRIARSSPRLVERPRDSSAVLTVACSFHELWQEWCADDTRRLAVRAIAAELRRRYAVVMPR